MSSTAVPEQRPAPAETPSNWWLRGGVLFSVGTLGFSQIFYNMILRNRDWFPREFGLYGWVLVWVQVLPLLLLLAGELFFARRGTRSRLFLTWRVLLYGFLAASYLRQFEVYHFHSFMGLMGGVSTPVWYLLALGGVALIGFLAADVSERYVALMAPLGLYFLGVFVAQTGCQPDAMSAAPAAPVDASQRLQEHPPVFILVADELSRAMLTKDQVIDRENFPNFARMADEGTWFTRAITNDAFTTESIPALLTGRIRPTPDVPTLFELLGSAYTSTLLETDMSVERWLRDGTRGDEKVRFRGKTQILGTHPLLAGRYMLENLIQSPFVSTTRHRTLHNTPAIHATFLTERARVEEAIRSGIRDGELLYWHFSVPHAPFIFDRDGTRHSRPEREFESAGRAKFGPTLHDPRMILTNYREQIRFTDATLGRVLDAIEEAGLWDRSLVVVTSDHGIRFWNRLPEDHAALLAEVPMFIRAPGLPPGITELDFQHIDLVPTLLDLLGREIDPTRFQGISALADVRPDRERSFGYGDALFRFDSESDSWRVVAGD